jgi:hypothetical protein
MEGLQFNNPESDPQQEAQTESIKSAELLKPLAREEAQMFARELGMNVAAEGQKAEKDTEGFLSKLAPRAKNLMRVVVAAFAFSGAFGVAFKTPEAEAGGYQERGGRQEYVVTGQDIYNQEYAKARAMYERAQAQRDVQDIRATARDQARADAEFSRDPRNIVGEARARESARIEAQEAQRRKYELERIGKIQAQQQAEYARQQAILAHDPVARLITGIFNMPNRVVSGAIDGMLDGR